MATAGAVTAGSVVYEFRGDTSDLRRASADIRTAMAGAKAEATSFGREATVGTSRASGAFRELAGEVREGVAALRRLEIGQASFNREVTEGLAELRSEITLIRELSTAHLALAAAMRQSSTADAGGVGAVGPGRGGLLSGFVGGFAAGAVMEVSSIIRQLPRAAREATEALAELGREADRLQIPVGLLRELQDAAERAGISAADLFAALDEVATRGRDAFASRGDDMARVYDEAAEAARRTGEETAEIVRQATELDARWTAATQTLRDEMLPTLQNVDSSMVSIVEWSAAFVRGWHDATAAARTFIGSVGNWSGWRDLFGISAEDSARAQLMFRLRRQQWGSDTPAVPTRDDWLRGASFAGPTDAVRVDLAAQLRAGTSGTSASTDWLRGTGASVAPTTASVGGSIPRASPAASLPALKEAVSEIRTEVGRVSTAAAEAGRSLADAFEEAALSGGTLREVLAGLSKDLASIVYDMTARPFVESVGTSLFGSIISGFGGSSVPLPLPKPRALGGPVTGGHPYIVGERRPELFVPDRSGTIYPDASSASGGRRRGEAPLVTVVIQAQDAQSVIRSEAQVTASLARAAARGRRSL